MEELSNDFNSAGALGQYFSFLRYVKGAKDQLTDASLKQVRATNLFVQDTLGFINNDPQSVMNYLTRDDQNTSDSDIDAAWIEGLIEERKTAKASKNWGRADDIRGELTAKKIVLKDNPDGSTSWKIQ